MAAYQLKPLSVGEILDTGFTIYRRHFGTFMGIAVVGYGAGSILTAYIAVSGGILEHLGLAFFAYLLGAVGGLLAAGATVRVISDVYLGNAPDLRTALSYAVGRMWPLFGAGVTKYLIITLAAIAFFIPGVIVACGYAVVAEVVVLERPNSTGDALGRSWALTRSHKLRAFALGAVVITLITLPVFAGGVVEALFPDLTTVVLVLSNVFSVIVYPLVACTFTLFYYDLRVRKEGFDLEVLSQQLGAAATA